LNVYFFIDILTFYSGVFYVEKYDVLCLCDYILDHWEIQGRFLKGEEQ